MERAALTLADRGGLDTLTWRSSHPPLRTTIHIGREPPPFSRPNSIPPMNENLLCAICGSWHPFDGGGTQTCPARQLEYHVFVGNVRSHSSRAFDQGRRRHTLRTRNGDSEQLWHFESANLDVEAKSGDLCVLTIFGGRVHSLRNLTIDRAYLLRTVPKKAPMWPGFVIAGAIIGVVALAVVAPECGHSSSSRYSANSSVGDASDQSEKSTSLRIAVACNLRRGPGSETAALRLIPKNTNLLATESRDGWHRVVFAGQSGWVSELCL